MAALLTACTDDGREPLIVYSPHGPDLLRTFEQRFEAENPEVDVQWLDMGSQEVLDRLRSERANPQADVWFGGPSQMFIAAAEENLLEPYDPPWADQVARYSDTQGRYHSVYLTPLIIAYNSEVVDSASAPQDWDEVLDERWADEVLIRDPVASGTMRSIFGMVIQRSVRRTGDTQAGFDWLQRLDRQTREYVLNPTLLYQKLARREGLVTLWDMPDIEVIRSRTGYPIDYLYASSGTPLVEDAIAVVRGTRHPELARRFVDFIGSEAEVAVAAAEYFRLPAREDVPDEALPPTLRAAREVIRPEPIDWALLHERGPEWIRYWDENIRGR
ncbi:MAG TPA: extracellular solute-binding protein [Longimicrobiales bacterium]|nr:extracellular solute-binding protein [Longimicrobiales bacterium]